MERFRPSTVRVAAATAFALVAFAGNSILCRLALGGSRIDAVSFTAFRLLSGAAALLAIAVLARRPRPRPRARHGWLSAAMLFVYAAAFSLAYLNLDVGVGALVLFGSVQLTMLVAGLRMGERPHKAQWLGIAAALGGLVYLVSPGLSAPPVAGALLMAVAGAAWGFYSLLGRGSSSALVETAGNFGRSAVFLAPLFAVGLGHLRLTFAGAALAIASGAIASGLGYAAWYAALPGLSATRAASVQLCVPVLAAFAGVELLSERISARLVIAAVAILGGVALTLKERGRSERGGPAPAPRV